VRGLKQLVARWAPEWLLQLLRSVRRLLWRVTAVLTERDLVLPPRPAVDPSVPARLLIGPANFAGQAWAWARAAQRELDGVQAVVMMVERDRLVFPADYLVPPAVYRSLRWRREQETALTHDFTHVLIDAMRPVLGNRYGSDCRGELALLRDAGLQVGLVDHGRDIRLGSLHRQLYPHSPWNDETWEHGRRLEAQASRLGTLMNEYDGPTFVSTPDLLDFAPRAQWLPVVVDLEPWRSDAPLLERERPVVLHAPTNPRLKGSHLVDPLLQDLHDRGRIEYRRIEGVPHAEMPKLVAEADLVLDQFVLGLYSVAAVEGMAAGRLVLAHVHDRVRARVGRPLPVVEATPDDLVDVIEGLLADRDAARAIAAQGPGFAAELHDGRRSAAVLAPFLGATVRA
jgi:hypothetical protein